MSGGRTGGSPPRKRCSRRENSSERAHAAAARRGFITTRSAWPSGEKSSRAARQRQRPSPTRCSAVTSSRESGTRTGLLAVSATSRDPGSELAMSPPPVGAVRGTDVDQLPGPSNGSSTPGTLLPTGSILKMTGIENLLIYVSCLIWMISI